MFPFVFGRFLLGCWVARKRLLHAIGMNPQAALSAPALWAWRTILRCGELGLGAAYASAFALLYINQKWRPRLEILAPVGRMAGLLLYWALLFSLQIAFSHWWLRRFRFGPMEWVWRSLTYRERQPMRRLSPVSGT